MRVQRKPRHAIWEITSACNLRCIHCEGSAGPRRDDELSTDEALALCDALAVEGCQSCNVSGGEPLLRRDWPQLCRRLADNGIRVVLVTNGTLLDIQAIDLAIESGVGAVALSLDGLRATHDRIRSAPNRSCYADVFQAISRIRAAGLPVAIITHVNQWNLPELPGMHTLLGEAGVSRWQVQLGLPLGRMRQLKHPYLLSPEQLPELARTLMQIIGTHRRPLLSVTDTIGYYTSCEPALRGARSASTSFWTGCYAGMLTVGIDSNGDVKGCSCLPKEFVAGNLHQRSFSSIWHDETGFAYNTAWDMSKLQGDCAGCAYRRLCRAGCTALAYSTSGSIYQNPYCLHRLAMTRGAHRD